LGEDSAAQTSAGADRMPRQRAAAGFADPATTGEAAQANIKKWARM
jgi:hypothetical protein